MKWIAAACFVVLAGCGGTGQDSAASTDTEWPDIDSRYSIGDTVQCDGQQDPVMFYGPGEIEQAGCHFENVTVDGVPACEAGVTFYRPNHASQWTVSNRGNLGCPIQFTRIE